MNKNEVMTANEFGALRSYLAAEVDQEDINTAIGTGAAGRTRAEITDELREWLRTRPKKI